MSEEKVAFMPCLNYNLIPSGMIVTIVFFGIKTLFFKNLITVHFQFDLLKLETNNTRDDKVKHAWIIAR
jgi:hypothetical protein